jgi:hypothetical protein
MRRGRPAPPARDNQVALNAIQVRHAREMRPLLKTVLAEQRQARRIVAKNKAQQRVHIHVRCIGDRQVEAIAPEPFGACFFCDIDRDFGRARVGRTAIEIRIRQPANHLGLLARVGCIVDHPQRTAFGRVIIEPSYARLHGDRVGVSGDFARSNGGVVDVDDNGQVIAAGQAVDVGRHKTLGWLKEKGGC